MTARNPGHSRHGRSIVLCLLIWTLCVAAVPRAHAQTTTLHLGLPISSDSPTGQNLREFARQVAARTSGVVRIEIEGENQRYDEGGVVSAVASGAIEMGAAPLSRFASDVPLAGAFLQPFLFNFDALIQAATNHDSEIRALIDEEILRRTNVRVLWWQPYGATVILAKNIIAANPAAIATRLIGASDKQMRDLIRVCGGAPTPVSPASLSAALQEEAVAAAAADIMNVREQELWRVASTIVDLRHAPSLYMVVINNSAWQKSVGRASGDPRRAGGRRASPHVGAVCSHQGDRRTRSPCSRACASSSLPRRMSQRGAPAAPPCWRSTRSAPETPERNCSRPTASFAAPIPAAATFPARRCLSFSR